MVTQPTPFFCLLLLFFVVAAFVSTLTGDPIRPDNVNGAGQATAITVSSATAVAVTASVVASVVSAVTAGIVLDSSAIGQLGAVLGHVQFITLQGAQSGDQPPSLRAFGANFAWMSGFGSVCDGMGWEFVACFD